MKNVKDKRDEMDTPELQLEIIKESPLEIEKRNELPRMRRNINRKQDEKREKEIVWN
jgi:hypothetical protein